MPKNHDLSVCKNWVASCCWILQANSSAGWFWCAMKRHWKILEKQAGFGNWSELYGQYSDAENYCGTQDWVPGSPLTLRPLTVSAERCCGSSSSTMKYLSRQSQSLEGVYKVSSSLWIGCQGQSLQEGVVFSAPGKTREKAPRFRVSPRASTFHDIPPNAELACSLILKLNP